MVTRLTMQHHFRKLKDPRINRRKKHLLIDIIVIALCAVLSGATDWQQIEEFGKLREPWLRRFLKLPNGIPSHDTFERVFDRIDPQAFHRCFQDWVAAIADTLKIKHIAIDGKTMRGSGFKTLGPLHMVSAWATEHHLCLGQVATAEKSNEITAIPELLELLELHGAIVTIDAMGCQKAIASKVIERGGHYVLIAKDNQPTLREEIETKIHEALATDFEGVQHDEYSTDNRGHGRVERRHCTILTNPMGMSCQSEWQEMSVIGMYVRERQVGTGAPTTETSYFIGTKKMSAKSYLKALRDHWGIENNLHWQLDITFAEDNNRVSKRSGAENLALLRKLALMMLKRHPSKKSLAGKQWKAALDTEFLEELLFAHAKPAKI